MTFTLAPHLPVDLATLIDTRLLIQANSGGGKSFCVRRLLEQTHGKVQHLVIDLEGEFASLREKFDYVLAGKDGDTPADPRSAKLLAERLLELKVSAILDIYELRHHDRVAFVRRFLDSLVNAPKALWHPVLVVVDEAHVFCPQQGEAESAGSVIDLCTRGRKRGFCAVLATQRLSKLHKDAAAECNNVLIGRSSLDVDTKRAADVLGFSAKDQQQTLRRLDPGEFFAYGPALSREVQRIKIGTVETTHPKAGGGRIAFAAPPPTAKVRAVLSKLADLPAEMEHRERTEAEYREEIARLKRQIAEKPAQPAPAPPKRVDVPILKDGQVKRLETALSAISKEAGRHREAMAAAWTNLDQVATTLLAAVLAVKHGESPALGVAGALNAAPPAAFVTPHKGDRIAPSRMAGAVRMQDGGNPAPRSNGSSHEGSLPPGERKLLIAIAQRDGSGINRAEMTIVTGYRRSTRNLYLQRLASKGLIELQGDIAIVTEAGRAELGTSYAPLPHGAALQEYWLSRLAPGEAEMLRAVMRHHPGAVGRSQLDEETGYKRSTRNVYLQRLAAARLVTPVSNGDVRASDTLFG